MKVMNKTEIKKATTKKVLNHLTQEWGAYDIDREAQYFDFNVDYKGFSFQMQVDTRGYEVSSWDSVKLVGEGWTKKQVDKQRCAVELEDTMNRAIGFLLAN